MSVAVSTVSEIEAERLSIARELHDVISYGFATISLQAGAAVHVADEKPQQAREALEAITLASKTALEELRGILGLLRRSDASGAPEIGLGGLDTLVEMTTKAGVKTCLAVDGERSFVPAAVDRAAYRIVQEALTNVLRHAAGATATVSVTYEEDRLSIVVQDDGAGAESESFVSQGSGFGILGMQERVLALGGNLEAGQHPEGGFRVRACLPIANRS
jgi:signal transduction histidine kinase